MALSLVQQATGGQLAQREQIRAGVTTGIMPLEDNSFEMMSQRLQAQEAPAVGGANIQRSLNPAELASLLVQSLNMGRV